MIQISSVKTPDYSPEVIKNAVAAHFDRLGARDAIAGKNVVIKPNLIARAHPDKAATTHPELLRAVIVEAFASGAALVTVAESPGGPYNERALKEIYGATHTTKAVDGTGAVLNLNTATHHVFFPEGDVLKSFDIIEPLEKAEYIINLPKLKTHGMMGFSCAVKNMFGSIAGLQKPELHYRFPSKEMFGRMLVDVCRYSEPDLTIVDAVWSMEGDGPTSGSVKKTLMTFAATNPYALDLWLCGFAGIEWSTIQTIEPAMKLGLCPQSTDEIEIEGDAAAPQKFIVPKSRQLDFLAGLPGPFKFIGNFLAEKVAKPRPVIDRPKCVACGRCAESCSPGAITFPQGKALIDPQKCIKCFCCHEMCPVHCIDIKRFGAFDL